MNELKKEYLTLRLDEIKVNKINPRVHNKLNVDMISKSINKIGFIDNIIVDENNVILAGHGRYLALKKMNKETAEVTRITGLTENQKKQYLIYSNRTTEVSDWDGEILVGITDELIKSEKDFQVGDFCMEELLQVYKEDEILADSSFLNTVDKNTEFYIAGFAYTKITPEINDVIKALDLIGEKNKDVDIFKGKRILTNKDSKL